MFYFRWQSLVTVGIVK